MLKLNVLALLNEAGKTKYWLNKQLGMGYTNFKKMVNNETKSISFENLEAMCYIFNCTPNDLLVFVDDEQEEK
ncbi:helix-turn-helix transcriptional regulator [Oscillospiraceae bacterium PP1C4]